MILTAEALPLVRYRLSDVQYTRFPVPSPELEKPGQKQVFHGGQSQKTVGSRMDFLSPAEAEFAYIGSGKENRRQPSVRKSTIDRVDSRLSDHIEERGRPLVSPLESEFPIQTPPARLAIVTPYPKAKKLDVLEEHKSILPVFLHFKTNVIIKDEFSLVTELSALLARLYFCSEDGIAITIDHSACLMLAGSFDPAYMLDVTTTPDQLKSDMNKTNTLAIQKLVQQVLNVGSHRGMLRYHSIAQEDVGTNGTTIHHMLNRTPRQSPSRQRRVSSASRGPVETAPTRTTSNPIVPRSASASASQVLSQQISSMSHPSAPSSVSGISALSNSSSSGSQATATPVSPITSFHPDQPLQHIVQTQMNFHKPRPASMYSAIGAGHTAPSSRPGSAMSNHREGASGAPLDWRPIMAGSKQRTTTPAVDLQHARSRSAMGFDNGPQHALLALQGELGGSSGAATDEDRTGRDRGLDFGLRDRGTSGRRDRSREGSSTPPPIAISKLSSRGGDGGQRGSVVPIGRRRSLFAVFKK